MPLIFEAVRVNRDGSHADRPRRLGAKKEAIENNLAEAAARLSSSPVTFKLCITIDIFSLQAQFISSALIITTTL